MTLVAAYCYDGNCLISPDPDDEPTGAPYCDGRCDRCEKSWGDDGPN